MIRRERAEANAAWLEAYRQRPPEYVENGERWRPVPGYIGCYEVSDRGRIKSLWFRNGNANQPRPDPIVIRLSPTASGYPGFTAVRQDGDRQTVCVHTAVLAAFVGPRPPRMAAAHWNGDKTDNRLDNLRWASYSANNGDDKRRLGRMACGERNANAKLTAAAVRAMRRLRPRRTLQELAEAFGVTKATAGKVCSGKGWQHVV